MNADTISAGQERVKKDDLNFILLCKDVLEHNGYNIVKG